MGQPNQTPEESQLAPLKLEKQQLKAECLSDAWAFNLITNAGPRSPLEELLLFVFSCIGQYLQAMTRVEDQNVDRLMNLELPG